ncbi:MAG TPA: ABC transporter permease [Tepidisphaeraceae bacterium]|nr:ABC transporter permease [Tepidisphaeraceae bacterium]
METAVSYQPTLTQDSRGLSRLLANTFGRAGRRELGMFAALACLCIVLAFSNPAFASASNISNTARQIGMLGILSIGSAFVIITGGIDLSVGSLVGLAGVVLAKISSDPSIGGMGYSFALGIPIALGVTLLIGFIQGLLITRLDLQPFIVTLGGMLAIRGISQTVVKGATLGFGDSDFRNLSDGNLVSADNLAFADRLPHWLHAAINFLIDGHSIPYAFWVLLAVIAVSGYLLHFTVFGRYVYAIGGNRDACQYSGIPVKRVETITYVISAGLAGIAGILYAAYDGEQSQNVGVAYELYAIAACVLGGCSLRGGEGTILGVLIGTALMRIIENGLNMFRIGTWHPNENWKSIVIGGVILVAVILDQLVHIAQQKRRTRGAALAAARASAPPAMREGAAPGPPFISSEIAVRDHAR